MTVVPAIAFVTVGTFWHFWETDREGYAVASAIGFPITLFVNLYPWGIEFVGVPIQWIAIFAVVVYPIGTFIGRLEPL